MKKLLLLASTFTSVLAFAQTTENSVKKDNIIIDVYFGGPQLLSNLSTTTNTGSISQSISSKGFGPFGGRIEYMITPKSSLGFEVNHASSTITSTWDDHYDKLVEEIKLDRTRFFPRYALHFGKKKLDAFWHVGLGVAVWSVETKTTDPSNSITFTSSTTKAPGTTLAFRTGVGVRYFFTDNFGLNADIGLGGALFTFGVTGKF